MLLMQSVTASITHTERWHMQNPSTTLSTSAGHFIAIDLNNGSPLASCNNPTHAAPMIILGDQL
jgi:hypothetical protein